MLSSQSSLAYKQTIMGSGQNPHNNKVCFLLVYLGDMGNEKGRKWQKILENSACSTYHII